MNSLPVWTLDAAAERVERPFSPFGALPGGRVLEPEDEARHTRSTPSRRVPKPFERLLGTLSLADLNEYREAAGRDPELDARALKGLNEAADRFFPIRSDETGARYLRNAYLKYLSQHADLAELSLGEDARFGPF